MHGKPRMMKSRSWYFLYSASRPLYWGVNPLETKSGSGQIRRTRKSAACAPLRGRVHDEDDLALELLKVVDLVAGAGRLEAVEGRVGHGCGGREKRAAVRGRKEREGLRCGTVYVRVGEEGAVTLTACDGDAVDEGFISRAGEI